MSSLFQIVFKGEVLDGFELVAVKASAARRLKAEPEQAERLFSGTRAVLKKGLTDEQAQRYFSELQRIGMAVTIEPERVKVPVIGTPAAAPHSELPIRNAPQRVTSRDEPAFDPMKTQIAVMPDDLAPPPPERWSQPTIAISQKHLSAMQPTIAIAPNGRTQGDESFSEPTLIVPPRSMGGSEPTMIVPPRFTSSSSDPMRVIPPGTIAGSEPTMIVPPRHNAASEPTMIVPPRHASGSEPTLIVPPRSGASREPSSSSASSDPTMIVAPRSSAASAPTIIVRSNQRIPTAAKTEDASFDPEKTELATFAAIEDYLSPPSEEQIVRATPAPSPSRAPIAIPPKPPANEDVQCPTCGDKQPLRVYCRRCGHALSLPPSSTGTRPITPPKPPASIVSDETVLVDEHDLPGTKDAARSGFRAAPSWLIVSLIFVLLLAVAAYLMF